MPTTSLGFRYPASSDAPNVPQYIQNLASDVNGVLSTIRTTAVDLALSTALSNVGSGYRNLCYWREGRTVHVAGFLKLNVQLAGLATVAFAGLPAGFRPDGTIASSTGLDGRFEVLTNGDIRLANGSLTTYEVNSPFALQIFFLLP